MLFVGIDLTSAFSRQPRAIDIAVLDDNLNCRFDFAAWPTPDLVISRSPPALVAMIASRVTQSTNDQIWAIDGPQGLASIGATSRHCENVLRTPGRTPDKLPAPDSTFPFHGYIRSSVDLFAAIRASDARFRIGGLDGGSVGDGTLFEVFPGSEWHVLAGRPLAAKTTQMGRGDRRALFARAGIRGLPVLPTADQLDALVGAYLAWCTHHQPDSVCLVGAPATIVDGTIREGMILHATRAPVSMSAEPSGATDAPRDVLPSEPAGPVASDDWADDEWLDLMLTDSGMVHGSVPKNRWLEPGNDYVCEAGHQDEPQRFFLRHSRSFSGGQGWTCCPSIPVLLKSLGLSIGHPTTSGPVRLHVRILWRG